MKVLQPWESIFEKKTRELHVLDIKLQHLNAEVAAKANFIVDGEQQRVGERRSGRSVSTLNFSEIEALSAQETQID
jgi:hypothetical protein